MKVLTSFPVLLLLLLLPFGNSMAQNISHAANNGLSIAIGGGKVYQSSDLANSNGIGASISLGSQLTKKQDAFLAFNWKFRTLTGENEAFDHRINADNTYSNIKYNFSSYDLELGLGLNRLRERTGIVLGGFAGAGITRGSSSVDLYDASNNLYNYSTIDPNRPKELIYKDLIALSDGNFETNLEKHLALLPTAGLYLGYQLSNSFTLGFEIKTHFYLSEENSIIGINLDNKIVSGSALDRNSYASVNFRWMFRGNSGKSNNKSVSPENNIQAVKLPPPTVQITSPATDPYLTNSSIVSIKAKVDHVAGPSDIGFTKNGFPDNTFIYNPGTKIFTAEVRLREGENNISIKATNESFTSEDKLLIIHGNSGKSVISVPVLAFISPAKDKINTSSGHINISAKARNINKKEDLQLTVNNNKTDFDFYQATGIVEATIMLSEGDNIITLTGSNEAGSAQDQLSVYVEKSEKKEPPKLQFINPLVPVYVQQDIFPFSARTENVKSVDDIRMKINGSFCNFSFNTNGTISKNLSLEEGVNSIEISISTDAGSISKSTTITFSIPTVSNAPPQIRIQYPSTSPYITYKELEELIASISNINSKDDITLYVNGELSRQFSFNRGNAEFTANISLVDGNNILKIEANNEAGSDFQEQDILRKKRPCPTPGIRLINPAGSQVSSNQQVFALSAEVSNIRDNNQIRLSVNGKNNAFRLQNNMLSSSIPLNKGSNIISLYARNECGEYNTSVQINYTPQETNTIIPNTVIPEEPCLSPKLSVSVNETDRKDPTHVLIGSVTNVENKADISLSINDQTNNNFEFNPANGKLNARFKFLSGEYTIVITAKNSCGEVQSTKKISYTAPVSTITEAVVTTNEEPCSQPAVTFTMEKTSRTDATHYLLGFVTNIDNKSGIMLNINGRSNNDFNFDPATGKLDAGYTLSPGSYTIVVTVLNSCGADSKNLTIKVEKPCKRPTVDFTVREAGKQVVTHEVYGTISNLKDRSGVSLTIDGKANNTFLFNPSSGDLNMDLNLEPGSHLLVISAKNECGSDSKTKTLTIIEPCSEPKVEFTIAELSGQDATHELNGTVTNVKNKTGISLIVDGSIDNGFQFVPTTGKISSKFKLAPGTHTILLNVKNECGSDSKTNTQIVLEPCLEPKVEFTIAELGGQDATHEMNGTVSNVKNKTGIMLTVDNKADNGFQYVSSSGKISAKFKLTSGTHTILVNAENECGKDSETKTIEIVEVTLQDDGDREDSDGSGGSDSTRGAESALGNCGISINPGNAVWQFCLVTSSGTFTRETLENKNFSYFGPADSLFFQPIGGGGEAIVNGKPYPVSSGKYYLFTGNIEVKLSNNNSGSIGQWSICITTDMEPETGNGNNRPKSPCEENDKNTGQKNGNKNKN